MIQLFLKVFSFGLLIDFLWVFYILFVSNKRYLSASIMSAAMALPAIFGFFEMYENRILVIPYLFGLMTGTFLGLRLHDFLEEKKIIE